MAKNYKVKDLNKNGKIDGWEQGKYNAINSATKMGKGYAMKMGSKQINSATNFKTKDAMLMAKSPMYMIGGEPKKNEYVDPSLTNAYGGYADPNSSDYIVNVTQNQMSENMSEMNQQYQPISKSSSSSDSNAYSALGGGLKKLITPKPGSQAEANQKYRQEKREAKRKAEGGTKVGNKLRKVFGTGKENKNL
jgi:hypothetical protein